MRPYLSTTGLSEFWDPQSPLLLLGPWCSMDKKNRQLLEGEKYSFVPSPWNPALRIKEASDYCWAICQKIIPQMADLMNIIHQVSYPEIYWRILICPWLQHFIEIFYDRFKRLENALRLYPNLYTWILPRERCDLSCHSTRELLADRSNEDSYNLKLFSLIAFELYHPTNIEVKNYEYNAENKLVIVNHWINFKRKVLNNLVNLTNIPCGPIVLTEMSATPLSQLYSLKWKMGITRLSILKFAPVYEKDIPYTYSQQLREPMILKGASDRFESLLFRVIKNAIPICLIEKYAFYRNRTVKIKGIDKVKLVASSTGWFSNERFKYFAAEVVANGAQHVEIQNMAGYGIALADPSENLRTERDIFFTCGWRTINDEKVRSLPNFHFLKLKDSRVPSHEHILFIGNLAPRYTYKLRTNLLPDDFPQYFQFKKQFLKRLKSSARKVILYRPYPANYGWNEVDRIREIEPGISLHLDEGPIIDMMKKSKIVVIDHCATAFVEALLINVPCILFWDPEIFLVKPEASIYLNQLRSAGILHDYPESAAEKLNEVFDDPISWWSDEIIQKARMAFCNWYVDTRKAWQDIWSDELNGIINN